MHQLKKEELQPCYCSADPLLKPPFLAPHPLPYPFPQFYIVRVDAPLGVATIAADGCFVTVESGPHPSLQLALQALRHPKQHVSEPEPGLGALALALCAGPRGCAFTF